MLIFYSGLVWFVGILCVVLSRMRVGWAPLTRQAVAEADMDSPIGEKKAVRIARLNTETESGTVSDAT